MMKKYTKSTPCLCSAPPRAFTNRGHGEMKAPVPRQHCPGGEPLPGFLTAFLSQPLVPIHFPLTFSTASLGFFFCILLRLLFHLSPMTSKILAKSCCDLFCDFWRRVWYVVGILQKQPLCVSASPLLVEMWQSIRLPSQAAHICAPAQARGSGPLPTHGRHEASIPDSPGTHKSPTPLWGEVWQLFPQFQGCFRQPSITGKHQMGWMEAILQKVLWDRLPQWSFQLEAERPESTAFSAQFHRLESYRWLPQAPEVCAASLDRICCKLQEVFCLSTAQLRPSFFLPWEREQKTQSRKSQKVGKWMFNVWNSLGLASCSKRYIRGYL